MGDLDRFRRCQEHLALWLRSSLTGCHFATSFSSTKPLKLDYCTPISEAIDLAAIAGFIDGTATNEVVAVVLFPSVRTPADLAHTLVTLSGDPRWQLGEEIWLAPWPLSSGLTDEWGALLDALEKVRSFRRQELVGGEPAMVDDLIRDVARIVRHRLGAA